MGRNTVPLGLVIGFCRSPSDVIRTRLTKKFFLTIPAGFILESQCFSTSIVPCVLEPVADSTEAREGHWARIVATGGNDKFCYTYPDASGMS